MLKNRHSAGRFIAGAALVCGLSGLTLFAAQAAQSGAADPLPDFSPDTYRRHVEFLAAPDMEGRGNGTVQLEAAGDYLAEQFRSFGLRPAGDNGTFYQSFEITTDTVLGPESEVTLGDRDLVRDREFSPMRFSESGDADGTLVFVGYGITAPEMHWDEYQGVDVAGKIVVALRHEPQENEDDSPFAGSALTSHSQYINKAINAKQHGAAGILYVLDANNHDIGEDDIARTAVRAPSNNVGLPAAYVSWQVLSDYFDAAGYDLGQLQAEIDAQLEPRSFEVPASRVQLRSEVDRIRKPVRNVVAALDGNDPRLEDEWVVVGAHYDHLGQDGEFSLARDGEGQTHHGADDNASGTAGILELARVASLNRDRFERSLLFIGFAGEELGLLGSSYFVTEATPDIDIENVTSMVNLDMIGRLTDDRVFVSGVGTSPEFESLLASVGEGSDIRMEFSESGMGASDHLSFNIREIPVLFFFSGLHGDYHRPTDTADKINVEGATDVLRLVYGAIDRLAEVSERPEYTVVEGPGAGAPGSGGGGGYGAYFGSVPDFRDDLNGVLFASVTAGSPAADAGFMAGDLLVEFGGQPVQNLYDFTFALQAHRAGDVVPVVVERNGERVQADVTLGSR